MLKIKGNYIYSNLKTSFLHLENFLLSCKKDELTGAIHFNFPKSYGYLLLLEGDIVGGIWEKEKQRISGTLAVQKILTQAKEKKGIINVSVLPHQIVTLITPYLSTNCQQKYSNLSYEYCHLAMLLSKLKGMDFTGYIEINFPNSSRQGLITMHKGKIKNIFDIYSDKAHQGQTIFIKPNDLKIVETSRQKKAFFNVYASI